MADVTSLLGPARDSASRGDLSIHDHVCGIYDSHEDEVELACNFIKLGLARREQCLYIAEHLKPAEFKALLEQRGVDVNATLADGSLLVMSGREMRLKLGGFTPASMLAFLGQAERVALESGFSAFRLAADMTWLRKDSIAPEDLFLYESELNLLLQRRKIVGLCQYSRDDFKTDLLIAAVETHPLVVYNDLVCDNFYYVPPDEFLAPGALEAKLTRLLYNVVSRERLMHHLLTSKS